MKNEIFDLWNQGHTGTAIAKKFGVSRQYVSQVVQSMEGRPRRNFADKARIIRQAGHKCEWCGEPEGLEVHHADGDPNNNEPKNAVVLCHSCHKKAHRLFHRRQVRIRRKKTIES